MKTEINIVDTDGHIIHDAEIQLSQPDIIDNCNKRIVMMIQDGILKIILKFKLEDGKIINPELMKIIADGSGVTVGDEFIKNIKPQEQTIDLEEYKQGILSDFAMWIDSEDWQNMLEAYNNGEE